MVKKQLKCGTTCIFDEDKYVITFNEKHKKINIYKKEVGAAILIGSFNPSTYFIYQYEKDGIPGFIIGDKEDSVMTLGYYLKQGISLEDINYMVCDVDGLDNICLIDDTFMCRAITDKNYLLFKGDMSKKVDRVKELHGIYEGENGNIIFVKQYVKKGIKTDYIKYGIDSKTLKIVTPIYSYNKDRIVKSKYEGLESNIKASNLYRHKQKKIGEMKND